MHLSCLWGGGGEEGGSHVHGLCATCSVGFSDPYEHIEFMALLFSVGIMYCLLFLGSSSYPCPVLSHMFQESCFQSSSQGVLPMVHDRAVALCGC